MWTFMVAFQAHVFQILWCIKAGPVFRESQAEILNKNIGADEMNHPFLGYSLQASSYYFSNKHLTTSITLLAWMDVELLES